MKRRDLLKSTGAAALLAATGTPVFAGARAGKPDGIPRHRVRPTDPDWPSAAEWDELRQTVGGRLERVASPFASCLGDPDSAACKARLAELSNPFFIQSQAGATQTSGWVDGWTSAPSTYVVIPESAADVAAAIGFAREKRLRLVIKGGAHSYLGQSNAPDSLLVWTHRLSSIALHDAFVPQGCVGVVAPQPAVSVGSGARFIQLYDQVVTKGGRFVQGGGCTSVGVGGHIQTGGFGSFSRYGGLGAASLLEAEIVTADGEVRIVNARSHPDLFRALKGGGAGFGVTTRLTLATRPLPERGGFIGQTITARSDSEFRRLTEAFLGFARDALGTPHWGEQAAFGPDHTLEIAIVFQGLSDDEARAVWNPFWRWIGQNPQAIANATEPRVLSMPLRHWWDFDYRQQHLPASIIPDRRPDAPPGQFWWTGNAGEIGGFLSGYQSLWLPQSLLQPGRIAELADTLVAASRSYAVTLHFNKGLAGATEERRQEAREAVIHPGAIDAFALAIIAGAQSRVYPGVRGHEPNLDAGRDEARRIFAAFEALRQVAPGGGSYSSEMSFFEERWQEAAWGPHYPELLAIKQKYDPDGLFTGHHQVGSELWSADGFTRLG